MKGWSPAADQIGPQGIPTYNWENGVSGKLSRVLTGIQYACKCPSILFITILKYLFTSFTSKMFSKCVWVYFKPTPPFTSIFTIFKG